MATKHPAKDYYWTKFVFSNLRYPVKSANLRIGGKDHPMKLIGGYWGAWTGPIQGDTSFKITEENGYTATSTKLFGKLFRSVTPTGFFFGFFFKQKVLERLNVGVKFCCSEVRFNNCFGSWDKRKTGDACYASGHRSKSLPNLRGSAGSAVLEMNQSAVLEMNQTQSNVSEPNTFLP